MSQEANRMPKKETIEFHRDYIETEEFNWLIFAEDYSNHQNKFLKEENQRYRDFLETIKVGWEWNIECAPEKMDKADYEKYDELCELLKSE